MHRDVNVRQTETSLTDASLTTNPHHKLPPDHHRHGHRYYPHQEAPCPVMSEPIDCRSRQQVWRDKDTTMQTLIIM